MADTYLNSKENLRKTFISFLFAFVTTKIFDPLNGIYHDLPSVKNFSIEEHGHLITSFSQILLAILVITTAWVGWLRNAVKPRSGEQLNRVRSSKFLCLLNDICILTAFYFLIATIDGGTSITSLSENKTNISFFPELIISAIIMSFYLIYTFIRAYKEEEIKTPLDYLKFLDEDGKYFREPWFFAFIVLANILLWLFYNSQSIHLNFVVTLLVDGMLMYFFWSYRSIRDPEISNS